MLKTLHCIATYLIIALGCVHMLFIPLNYSRFTLGVLWFAGAGLAIIFAGFLNVALSRGVERDRVVWLLCLSANLILAMLFAGALYVLTEPQVFIGTALFAFASGAVFMMGRDRSR